MFDWLWNADVGLFLGAFGFITGIASLLYARSQARGAHAQVSAATDQAREALLAAQLVAKGAREQAVEALRAAGLVAENARLQAVQALRAAELVATSAVSARVREMRARNFRFNPGLPSVVRSMMEDAGGPDAYGLVLDTIDIAQEIFSLRKGGVVTDEHWRMWMNDQIAPMAKSNSFRVVFRHATQNRMLSVEFREAFQPVLVGGLMVDPLGLVAAPDEASNGKGNGTNATHGRPVGAVMSWSMRSRE